MSAEAEDGSAVVSSQQQQPQEVLAKARKLLHKRLKVGHPVSVIMVLEVQHHIAMTAGGCQGRSCAYWRVLVHRQAS